MRRPSGPSLLAVCLGLFAVPDVISLSAQQPPPTPPELAAPSQQADPTQHPPFRTEANYVRVDVFPTRNGRPVQDLRAEDFEVLENGRPQQVQAFEHVVISPAGPQSLRQDPGSARDAEQQAGNPRNRVFVFFLDVPHVMVEGGAHIREPVIRLMDRMMGDNDLVAFMTPEMAATQVTFGRKTDVVGAMLREGWTWGKRHSIMEMDETERAYELCYPGEGRVVQGMITRRRERMVLDALHDLVRYLGGIREERKAILAVTEGWLLYKPDASITRPYQDPVTGEYGRIPGKPPVGVDEHGTLRLDPPRRGVHAPPSITACDRDRMHLAALDNEHYFRSLLDTANRNNASFYPMDPRGLAVFDHPLGPAVPPSIVADRAMLRQRLDVIRTLADNTDGLAIVDSNDLDGALRRIADDLTSYYLLGYYSNDPRLDGSYRRITVRVKRPGVDVRARRGYRAATVEDVRAGRAGAEAPVPDHISTANAALATLALTRPDQRFSVHAVPVRAAADDSVTALWVVGEIVGPLQEFAGGSTAAIQLDGGATGSLEAALAPGERTFVLKVPVQAPGATIDVKARVTTDRSDLPLSDTARVDLDSLAVRPLLFRRGPSTGNRIQPAADFRFSRTERVRVELPVSATAIPGTARLLDRNAQPLQLPVAVAERTADDGQRWITADATLAPLGAGDYVVELSYTDGTTEQQVLTGIRVTR